MKKLTLTIVFLVLLAGCGGGGSGGGETAVQSPAEGPQIVTPAGTPFQVKVALDPSGASLTSFAVSLQLPPEVAVATDGKGKPAPGVVTFSGNIPSNTLRVTNYRPDTSRLTVSIPTNAAPFQGGEITLSAISTTGVIPAAEAFGVESEMYSGSSKVESSPDLSVH